MNELAELNSNSGASFSVSISGGVKVIEKTITCPTVRDVLNLKKQIGFSTTDRCEAVELEINEDSKKVLSYTMPYINGLVGCKYSKQATHTDIKLLSNILRAYFVKKKLTEKVVKDVSSIMHIKLNDLKESVTSNSRISNELLEISLNNIINLEQYIEVSPLKIPISECHGDFTFSNMILDSEKRRLYLIDFLNVFVESYLLDYVKLLQDIDYGWSLRYENEHLNVKNRIIGTYIKSNLSEIVYGYDQEI